MSYNCSPVDSGVWIRFELSAKTLSRRRRRSKSRNRSRPRRRRRRRGADLLSGLQPHLEKSLFYTLLPWDDVATSQRPHTWVPPVLAFDLQNYELNNCFYEVLRLKCFILRTQDELTQSTDILSKKKKQEVKGRSLWILWEKEEERSRASP